MNTAEALAQEVDEIIASLRVNLATNLEALAKRSDALADLALVNDDALRKAMCATAVVHVYSTMQNKVEALMTNPEQVEAVIDSMSVD